MSDFLGMRPIKKETKMKEITLFIAIIAFYFLMQLYILPKLGIST
jgi:hypothetical protein